MAVLGALGGLGLAVMVAGLTGRRVLPVIDIASSQRSLATATTRLGAVLLTATTVLVITRWPVAAALAGVAAVATPRIIGGKAARERAIARTEAIATWTEMVRDSITAASGLEEAINATAPVAPAAIRREVRLLVSRLERQSLAPALVAFGQDLAHPSGDLVVAALTIAARTEASDLSSLLSRLADAIRGDARMRIRVEVGRTRVRTASKVILGVVTATIALLALLNRDYLEVYGDAAGQAVLLVIGGIFALGDWLLVRMGELDMPERFTARAGEAGR
jgi:tight adherence protein B